MRARDARVPVDFGDVAVLDLPARLGVPRHLPLEVSLDFRNPVDDALIFEVIGAQRAFGQLVPTQVDVLGAGAEFIGESDVQTCLALLSL